MAAIPDLFVRKKLTILEALATPDDEYSDLSPKGSVDISIRDLISEINDMEGLVTTSSCGGRISVFLEGGRTSVQQDSMEQHSSPAYVPGGKGNGGRWLFVSHSTVAQQDCGKPDDQYLSKLFGMSSYGEASKQHKPNTTRYVKFQFEPMVTHTAQIAPELRLRGIQILHIMAASLHHARPVLSAAINAGFRESGVQSLKNLNDRNAFPMVAVRSSGLAFSSLVGFVEDDTCGSDINCIVTEGYLQVLLGLANKRFEANSERVARFRYHLSRNTKVGQPPREDKEERKERMKAQGLAKQVKNDAMLTEDHVTIKNKEVELEKGTLLERNE